LIAMPHQYDPRRDPVASECAANASDHCTRPRALRHTEALDRWWHARGHTSVRQWVEPYLVRNTNRGDTIWMVRSNLVGGLPPKP
jgi:hypothetical protein